MFDPAGSYTGADSSAMGKARFEKLKIVVANKLMLKVNLTKEFNI